MSYSITSPRVKLSASWGKWVFPPEPGSTSFMKLLNFSATDGSRLSLRLVKIEIATTKTCHWMLGVMTAWLWMFIFSLSFPYMFSYITIENKPQNGCVFPLQSILKQTLYICTYIYICKHLIIRCCFTLICPKGSIKKMLSYPHLLVLVTTLVCLGEKIIANHQKWVITKNIDWNTIGS